MKTLFAGPWYGEFGWELLSWQARLRKLSRSHDHTIVCSFPTSEALYTDFADEIHFHYIKGRKDTHRMDKVETNIKEVHAFQNSIVPQAGANMTVIRPAGYIAPGALQEFIRYGRASNAPKKDLIIIHARSRTKSGGKGAKRDWEKKHWVGLVNWLHQQGYEVGAVGVPHSTYDLYGVIDFRYKELQVQMDCLSAAKLVVGTSSGPMHLASLCGAPHLVWTADHYASVIKATNVQRYLDVWNPLHTPVCVLNGTWHPKPEYVADEIQRFLELLETHSKGAFHEWRDKDNLRISRNDQGGNA